MKYLKINNAKQDKFGYKLDSLTRDYCYVQGGGQWPSIRANYINVDTQLTVSILFPFKKPSLINMLLLKRKLKKETYIESLYSLIKSNNFAYDDQEYENISNEQIKELLHLFENKKLALNVYEEILQFKKFSKEKKLKDQKVQENYSNIVDSL